MWLVFKPTQNASLPPILREHIILLQPKPTAKIQTNVRIPNTVSFFARLNGFYGYYMGSKRVRERCSIRGFFSEAELELAVNGMHGLVKPFGIKKGLYEESRRVKASSRLK